MGKPLAIMGCEFFVSCIDEDGMNPGHAIARHEDEKFSLLAIDMHGSSEAAFMFAMGSLYDTIEGLQRKGYYPRAPDVPPSPVVEAIMGLDFVPMPGQGAEFNGLIAVFHWTGNSEWRYGVIDYQKPALAKQKIVRPIQWDHPHWSKYLRSLHGAFRRRYRPIKLIQAHYKTRGWQRSKPVASPFAEPKGQRYGTGLVSVGGGFRLY